MGDEGLEQQGRIAQGYGALIAFLATESKRGGATIHRGAEVSAIASDRGRVVARCTDGTAHEADAILLTVPLPVLAGLDLPPALRESAAAAADIGFGNVVKILLRFASAWWAAPGGRAPADLSFLFSGERVPTWWTQHPDDHPVLTGWFAGPKADTVSGMDESELVEMGLASLATIFERPLDRLRSDVVGARAINWGRDPFARGAYSYATPETRAAQAKLGQPKAGVYISGEALYAGRDMGTVEAALASGLATARMILGAGT